MSSISSKPIHPATVHFPIAFLSLSYGLDLLYFTLTTTALLPKSNNNNNNKKQPSFMLKLVPDLAVLPLMSNYLLALGVVSGIISVLSGATQLLKMINNAGLYESDGKTMRPKIKTAFAHAAMNDVAIAMAGYSWWARSSSSSSSSSSGGGDAVAAAAAAAAGPGMASVVISAVSMPALLYAASLGGSLVYNHGVGINLSKKGKKSS